MLHHSRKEGRTAFAAAGPTAVLLAAVFALACEQATTSPPEQATLVEPADISADVTAGPEINNKDFAALRRATARFHDFGQGVAAGYKDELTGCVEQQGFHYATVTPVPFPFDGTVKLRKPEVLMYEPKAGGGMRLVGVEYIVPKSYPRPSLFGQEFRDGGAIWLLHVWVWRRNPNGMFADNNPKVSCKHDAA